MLPAASNPTSPCATFCSSTASGAESGPWAGSRSLGSPPITTTLTAPSGCWRHAAGDHRQREDRQQGADIAASPPV